MSKAQWAEYPNFTDTEFDCRHTGWNEMQHEFMSVLQAIRSEYGQPMQITSGFRHPTHPVERVKGHTNGEHTAGCCADVACVNSSERFALIRLALKHGITRIGIAPTFLHLGIGSGNLPKNVIWEYV